MVTVDLTAYGTESIELNIQHIRSSKIGNFAALNA